MDDKLYYVESPDEQVLGPMTMMHVLEGVAAGVILESARICEVGAQEWVYLSDVAYTREGEGDPGAASSFAEDRLGTREPEEASGAASGDAWSVEGAAGASSPEPAGFDSGVMHGSTWQPSVAADPSPEDEPANDPFASPSVASEAGELVREHAYGASKVADEAPAGDAAADPWAAEPSEEETFAAPFDGEENAEDPFAGGIEQVDEIEPQPAERKRRSKWLVPALVTLALPAIVGGWMLTGRPLPFIDRVPFLASLPFLSPEEAPAPEPVPEVSPLEQAHDLLAAGQAAEAMLRYESILAEDPGNPTALHGHGMAARGAGDPEAAIRSLTAAVSASDGHPAWVADLAEVLHESGSADSALARMGAYLTAHPEDRERQVTRLDWLLEAGRPEEAARVYTGLAQDNPVNAHSQYLAGLALGGDAAAESYLRRAIELDPESADAYAALGRLLAGKGEAAAAKEALTRAFERRPATTEERALLASLDRTLADEQPAPAPPEPKPTVTAAAKPQPKAAEPVEPKRAKTVATASEPAPAKAVDFSDYAKRIRRELDRERFESAAGLIAEAKRAVGNSHHGRNNVRLWEGILAYEEGRFDDALAKFESLDGSAAYRASGFGTGAPSNWIARVWLAKGDVRKAIAALDGVGPDDPDEYAVAQLWEGLALATLGMDDLAARTWERIPGDVGARVRDAGRGAVKSAELLTGAISAKEYRTAVSPLSGFGNDMWFFLAYAAQRDDDPITAKKNFTKAVEESAGREFPYHLARAQIVGDGILGGN